jgi:hypothetical protein
MAKTDPPSPERRSSPRRPPRYTPQEVDALRITRVHLREDFLFCLLSDGNMLCVPLSIAPQVLRAPEQQRYLWQITGDGKSISWSTRAMGVRTETLSLERILAHPEAHVTELPSD